MLPKAGYKNRPIMTPLFKYPRALVRNAAKLEQLQNKVFLPLVGRHNYAAGLMAVSVGQ